MFKPMFNKTTCHYELNIWHIWLCMPIDFCWNKKAQTIEHVHGLYMTSVYSLTDSGCNSVTTNWICHVPTQQQQLLLPVSFSHLNDDVYMEGSLEQCTNMEELPPGQHARWINAQKWKNYLLDNIQRSDVCICIYIITDSFLVQYHKLEPATSLMMY